MIEDIVKLLKEKQLKIAFAESVTGGLLSSLLTDYAGASLVFELGVVSYSNLIKEKFLNISHSLIDKYGVVSKEVAEAMALSVKELANSSIGIGITGSAGPTVLEGSVVGEVWVSIVYLNNVENYHYIFENKSRIEVKQLASNNVFKELYQLLINL